MLRDVDTVLVGHRATTAYLCTLDLSNVYDVCAIRKLLALQLIHDFVGTIEQDQRSRWRPAERAVLYTSPGTVLHPITARCVRSVEP